MAMTAEGVTVEEARSKIWMVDSQGLIVKDRPSGGVTGNKIKYAHDHCPIKSLGEIVKFLKPTVLIGAAAVGGAFTMEILQDMGEFNERPVIFALSNPTSKAECTAEQAYTATDVRVCKHPKTLLYPFILPGTMFIRKWLPFPARELQRKNVLPRTRKQLIRIPGNCPICNCCRDENYWRRRIPPRCGGNEKQKCRFDFFHISMF